MPTQEALDALVHDWLTLPDVAERTGLDITRVRRLIQERALIAVRRGPRSVLSVPAALLDETGQPLHHLQGTIVVLADSGLSPEESIEWLFTPDDTLPGTPVDALVRGHKTEVRRRAQALAV